MWRKTIEFIVNFANQSSQVFFFFNTQLIYAILTLIIVYATALKLIVGQEESWPMFYFTS